MFRNRFALALLVAVAILPLVGCANRRCCYPPPAPAYAAPDCCPPGAPGIHP
jgi:hypothetical protein